jgi:electron transfer flavoprotein alpha subunit
VWLPPAAASAECRPLPFQTKQLLRANSCNLPAEMFQARKSLSTFSSALAKRFGSSLVIADHNNKVLNAATLSAITAAKKFGSVHVLVAGSDCAAVASEASKAAGVDGVIVADKPTLGHFLPENLATTLKDIITAGKYTHVVGATTSSIKSVIPRLAVLMNVSPITDVIAIKVTPARLLLCTGPSPPPPPPLTRARFLVQGEDTFVRPIYAGNALSTVKSSDAVKIITVRPTNFEKVSRTRRSSSLTASLTACPRPLPPAAPLPSPPPPPPRLTLSFPPSSQQRFPRATAPSWPARAL